MIRKLVLVSLITSFFQIAFGQTETYTISKTSFCSDKYDEFSPAYYKNGLVFCTNRNVSLLNYSTSQNKGLYKINYIDTTGYPTWQSTKLFSKELTTQLNDGPATFNSGGDTIYFSRNLEVNTKLGDISGPRNKLGIFNAVLAEGKWTKIREFRINNEWFNVTTPCLSHDGKRLYFASDKPGGYGGSDLYYCQWENDYWNNPVNLGPNINTTGNEAYPFINPAGEMFFSSDGYPGIGGKDIFYSRYADSSWLSPIHINAPINSPYDDFGIITDSLMNEGFFSSNRDKTIDIFHFKTNIPQIFYTTIQKENQYCFMLSDSGNIIIDTLNIKYIWDFGDGKKDSGEVVKHCFPGAGKYLVRLDLVERATEKIFFSKLLFNVELRDFEQPYINSYDVSIKGDSLEFDGLQSHLSGYKILSFSWDFGDGTRKQGEKVKHSFKEDGQYLVNLELTLKSDLTGKIHKNGSSKKILVLNDLQEISSYLSKTSSSKPDLPDIMKSDNAYIKPLYSAETEFKQDALFQVEIASSNTKIGIDNYQFRNVPKKYNIIEKFNPVTGNYSYIIDQQMNLMATYIAFKEMENSGFKNVRTKIEVLKDPAEQELNNIKKLFGTLTDSYFDSYSRLTSNAYLFLDRILKIMNKHPEIKLEVAVHTDNTGKPEDKLVLSDKYAHIINNYLIDKGILNDRLIAKGFGGSKPIAPNSLENDKSLNRRIDFTIIRE